MGEFNSLFYLIKLALIKQVYSLQMKGNSSLTINWKNDLFHIVNNSLYHPMKDLKELKDTFILLTSNVFTVKKI